MEQTCFCLVPSWLPMASSDINILGNCLHSTGGHQGQLQTRGCSFPSSPYHRPHPGSWVFCVLSEGKDNSSYADHHQPLRYSGVPVRLQVFLPRLYRGAGYLLWLLPLSNGFPPVLLAAAHPIKRHSLGKGRHSPLCSLYLDFTLRSAAELLCSYACHQ